MAIHRHREEKTRNLARCATCAVMTEADWRNPADANTVCAMCGKPMVDSPSERGSYFEVVMRLGRPGPAARPRGTA